MRMHRRRSTAGLLSAAASVVVWLGFAGPVVHAEEPEPATTTIAPPTTEPPPTTAPTTEPPTTSTVSPPTTEAPSPSPEAPSPTEPSTTRSTGGITPSTLVSLPPESSSTTTSSTTTSSADPVTSSTRPATPSTSTQGSMVDDRNETPGRGAGLLLPVGVAGVTAMVAGMGVAIWRIRRRGRRVTPIAPDEGFLAPPRPSTEPIVPLEPLVFSTPIGDRSPVEPSPTPPAMSAAATLERRVNLRDGLEEHDSHLETDAEAGSTRAHHGHRAHDERAGTPGTLDLGDLSGMWPDPEPSSAAGNLIDSEELSRLLFPDHPVTDRTGRG